MACDVTETGDNGDTLWYLLTAYELNPGVFPQNQINLPESGTGLPDILNQAKWELDWYLKMQMTDGHVLEGVHVTNLGTLASPPSADTTTRGYNPPSYESEAVFVASTAHAARIFSGVPAGASYAVTLRQAAETTWNDWVLNAPTTVSALSYLSYGVFKVWAASEMFRMETALGGPASILSAAQSIVDNYTTWSSYALNPSGPYADWALLNYLQTPGATNSTVTGMETALGNYANAVFSQNDLYNSGMYSWMYSWGSNQNKACAGLELYFAGKLGFTGGTYSPAQCMAHAEDFLHYFHGANPMNMVYITNTDSMGAKHCVWQVWNTWFGSYNTASSKSNFIGKPAAVVDPLYPYVAADNNTSTYGPPPGYVADHPTFQYFSLGGTDVPPDSPGPAEAPYEKAYRDYNQTFTSGSQDWIVNEAGIYNSSSYMALSSVFAVAPGPSPTPTNTGTSTYTTTSTPTNLGGFTSTPTPTFTSTVTSTSTASPTITLTPTTTSTSLPSAYCPVTMISDFENESSTNLWGGAWTTVLSSATIAVTYDGPGAAGTNFSAGVTGTVASGGYAEWYTYLYASHAAFNAASYGIQGVQFWMKGDGSTYRMQIITQGVTDDDYYGVNITTIPDGNWHFYPVPFSAMVTQGWGTQTGLPVHPTANDVTGIIFVTQIAPSNFAYSVDQIGFYCSTTVTPTATPTFSPTSTSTYTPTKTLTQTITATTTPTVSATQTSSPTPTLTPTSIPGTPTNSMTPTGTNTMTNTFTSTSTPSSTPTYTSTYTPSPSPSPMASPTYTPTPMFTATSTATSSTTVTPTSSSTATFTSTSTNSMTPTFSFTFSPTPTWTPTPTLTTTPSPTTSPSPSITPTGPAYNVLYPNPVKGNTPPQLYLALTASASVRVQIFTIAYRKIWDKTYNPVVPGQILTLPSVGPDGNPLSNGLYYVVVTVNGKREKLKLIVLK